MRYTKQGIYYIPWPSQFQDRHAVVLCSELVLILEMIKSSQFVNVSSYVLQNFCRDCKVM